MKTLILAAILATYPVPAPELVAAAPTTDGGQVLLTSYDHPCQTMVHPDGREVLLDKGAIGTYPGQNATPGCWTEVDGMVYVFWEEFQELQEYPRKGFEPADTDLSKVVPVKPPRPTN